MSLSLGVAFSAVHHIDLAHITLSAGYLTKMDECGSDLQSNHHFVRHMG